MMLREQGRFAAVLGIALLMTAAPAPAQSAAHKANPPAKVVQPDQGPPPDQAVQPDISTQLPAGQQEQFPEPVVAPPTEPAPAVPVVAAPPPVQTVKVAAEPQAPPPVPANTPEGRQLQAETATLLALAQDLKAELEKAGNDTLSLVALRKVAQIEKMSKDLKQEMNKQGQATASK
jgi:hypothetical protein